MGFQKNNLNVKENYDLEYIYNNFYSKIVNQINYKFNYVDGESEDYAMDIILKIQNKIHTFNPDIANINTWVMNITRNHMIDVLRKRKLDTESISDYTYNISNDRCQFETYENKDIVTQINNKLNNYEQSLISDKYIDNLTHKELSSTYNISKPKVQYHIRTIKNKIKKMGVV